MKLVDLIKKGSFQRFATATPATPATHGGGNGSTVATVATVAVANSQKQAAEHRAQPIPTDVLLTEYRLYTRLAPPPRPPVVQPDPEPPADPQAWHELAQAYHAHHFHCHQCQAAGRGIQYGRRCGVGLALWNDYDGAGDLQTQGA